jgi:carboxylesterase type B
VSGAITDPSTCGASLLPPASPLEREDCLFLDVIVPEVIFDGKTRKKAPVAVWIYGGGFAFGKKGDDGNPAGLMARSQELDPEGRGIIYVTLNYRVRNIAYIYSRLI